MDIGKTLEVNSAVEWRNWLADNHSTAKEIWLIFYKKATGKQKMWLDEAVSEALCFGWIDNIEKKIDEEKYVLRFSPRKPKSNWSESNKTRVKKLLSEGKMTKFGLDTLPAGLA